MGDRKPIITFVLPLREYAAMMYYMGCATPYTPFKGGQNMNPEYEKLMDIMDEAFKHPIQRKESEMKMDAEHDTDAYGRREPQLSDRRQGVNGMRAKLVEYKQANKDSKNGYLHVEAFLDWVEATR